ncbi:Abhydrolase domain-containing protein mpaH [Metarhizium brunneum]|uniref:Abhydrolase domain-containing protein mpaH n=1 Tax=Metarhizium brunneum TaxID=500148 RepID=A0A7D5ZAU5_9HYPO
MSTLFRQVEHTISGSHTREYLGATANGDDHVPKLAVKQYIPLNNPRPQPGDVTIIGAHANGFPKELYEPLWDDVYDRLLRKNIRIRSVWIADIWNQGQSGVLNEKMLGNDPSWFDHARDLMNLINSKQDDIRHPIVGIGHSMGGTQLCLLSLMHPRLLDSLVLIDPVIQLQNGGVTPAMLSTRRRDAWPSTQEAASKFKETKFYQAWDPRVLDRWVEYGLRRGSTELYPDADGEQATLTTTKHQELFTFLRPTYRSESADAIVDRDPLLGREFPGYPFYRPEPAHAFQRLPELRPSTLYIFGNESEMSQPDRRREKMARTGTGVGGSGGAGAGRVRQAVLDCGHLVAMEKVAESADTIADFLEQDLARQAEERRQFERRWKEKTRREQFTVDERWAKEVKPSSLDGRDTKL